MAIVGRVLRPGRPSMVFEDYPYGGGFPSRGHDIAPDGSIYVGWAVWPDDSVSTEYERLKAGERELRIILHFAEELRGRVPR